MATDIKKTMEEAADMINDLLVVVEDLEAESSDFSALKVLIDSAFEELESLASI